MTLADFYTRVLRELKVVPPNGTAASEDRQRVVDIYPQVHAMLLSRGLAKWAATDAIPDEYAIPVIKITAFYLTSDFSVPDTQYLLLKQEGELDAIPQGRAERMLRKLQSDEYVAAPIHNEFF